MWRKILFLSTICLTEIEIKRQPAIHKLTKSHNSKSQEHLARVEVASAA